MPADLLLVMPLLVPLYGALLCLLFWRLPALQAVAAGSVQALWLGMAAYLLHRVLGAQVLATQVGNWPAPFGITLVADLFSALLYLAGALIGLVVFLYSLKGIDETRRTFGYYPMLLLLQMGVGGACLAGDLFNLYVWFEVILIACFALLSLGGTRVQLEGTLKYVAINFFASGLLLTGVGVVYSLFGSLNMAELALLVRQSAPLHPNLPLLSVASVFFLTGFGIKAAIFPFYFWLPASYHTPPIAISAFIAGLITKVGIYVLIRLFTLIFVDNHTLFLPLFSVLAGFTMLLGVVGAAAQTDFRKILSFHIISQIGYMLMGLAIYTPLALAGSIFFILHNILVKTHLFLVSGSVANRYGSFALSKLGGVYKAQPVLALVFMLSALSLAGIPPLSGFWGKFMLARAGFENGNYMLVGVSLFVSLITLFSMTKIWNEVFWKPRPKTVPAPVVPPQRLLYLPLLLLLSFILFIGLYASPLVRLSQRAAQGLLHIETYTDTVLGINSTQKSIKHHTP